MCVKKPNPTSHTFKKTRDVSPAASLSSNITCTVFRITCGIIWPGTRIPRAGRLMGCWRSLTSSPPPRTRMRPASGGSPPFCFGGACPKSCSGAGLVTKGSTVVCDIALGLSKMLRIERVVEGVLAALQLHILADRSPSDMKPSKTCMLGSSRMQMPFPSSPCTGPFHHMIRLKAIRLAILPVHPQKLGQFAAKKTIRQIVCPYLGLFQL